MRAKIIPIQRRQGAVNGRRTRSGSQPDPVDQCIQTTYFWLEDITAGVVTIDDAVFEFGLQGPQYHIIRDALNDFTRRAIQVGQDQASQETYDSVIVPRCEQEYGGALLPGIGAAEGEGYDGV
jgi:hypothetical protein